MKFFSTNQTDCLDVRDAFAYAKGFPFKPSNLPEEQAAPLRSQWLAATRAQRDAWVAQGLYDGWTLYQSDVFPEDPPGTRFYTEVDDAELALADAAALFGRVLSTAQILALQAAVLTAIDDFPPDWVFPP